MEKEFYNKRSYDESIEKLNKNLLLVNQNLQEFNYKFKDIFKLMEYIQKEVSIINSTLYGDNREGGHSKAINDIKLSVIILKWIGGCIFALLTFLASIYFKLLK